MDRNLATLSKAAALSAVFAAAAALSAVQQAPAQRRPASPPPPPPRYAPPVQRQERPNAGAAGAAGPAQATRREGGAHPSGAQGGRSGGRGQDLDASTRLGGAQVSARASRTPAQPKHLPRRAELPTHKYWDWRYNEIRGWLVTQKGFIPVTPIPSGISRLTDYTTKSAGWRFAGWKGYGLVVPPGESVTFNLYHPNRPWFRLFICDKWGGTVPGGLSSLMPQPVPRLVYTNPGLETETIYLIVDDPGWMSHEQSPYTLDMDRTWNPDLFPEDLGAIVRGIWGNEAMISAEFRRQAPGMPWRR